MDEQNIEMKRKAVGELKQFARAEMARDMAKRHGRALRLPWDPEEAAPEASKPEELDKDAIGELAGMIGGGD